jgi:molecular chaperone GrpE
MNDENDISIEQDDTLDDSVLAEESQGASIKKLKEKLKSAEQKAKEYLDGWQRGQADFANLRRRDEEAKMEFLKFANQSLLEELIPVLDSFTIAIAEGHQEILPIYKQFMSVLKGKGLEELEPLGEVFDPRLHEAIGVTEVSTPEEDQKITQVLQKGYKLSDKIIRAAKVKIGEYHG